VSGMTGRRKRRGIKHGLRHKFKRLIKMTKSDNSETEIGVTSVPQMEITAEIAEAANRATAQILDRMNHEIRAPLNTIMGFTQVLQKQSQALSLPLKAQQWIKNIQEAGTGLSEVINNIIDLAKIETGKTPVAEEDLNLKLLFQGIFHLCNAQASSKQVVLSYDFHGDLPEMIRADRIKLNRILQSLVDNAVKYTPPGKKVEMLAQKEKNSRIIFKIIDQGAGMTAEQLNTLFDTVVHPDHDLNSQFRGAGMGLALTRQLVTLLKGELTVASEVDQGTTFTCNIPLLEASYLKSIPEIEPEVLPDQPISKGQLVLLVEDNKLNQNLIEVYFNTLNLDLEIAENGLEGVEKMVELKPGLVLMDLNMPVMDGLTATRKIRANPDFQDTPIILISAVTQTEIQREAKEAGITDFLDKPIIFKKLSLLVSKYLPSDESKETESKSLQADVKSKIAMPQAVLLTLANEYELLQKIPPFAASQLEAQLQKMLGICGDYETEHTALIKTIDRMIFSRKATEIPNQIQKGLLLFESAKFQPVISSN